MPAPLTLAPQNNAAGVLFALAAGLCFSVNDMAMKFLSGSYALHQIVLMRAVVALVLTVAILMPLEGGLALIRTRRPGAHLLRGVCVVFSNMCFFLALAAMPMADAMALFFICPMFITALSVVVLGEKVGPRRWAAVAVGLVGVIVMMRPGSGAFQLAALLPLAAALSYATLTIVTRRIGGTERAATMTFYITLAFIVVSGAMGIAVGDGRFADQSDPSLAFLLRGWVWPAPADAALIALAGMLSAVGAWMIAQAYRMCEAGLAAPFEYIALPLAIFWGAVVFDDWPDLFSWTGMALIVGSGLYMLWREALRGRRIAARRPSSVR
jgi:drug/metabolite transporter (DMT)-like permease